MPRSALDGTRPGRLAGLPRRIALTYRYHGLAGLARHTVMFPLRLTGLDRALGLGTGPRRASAAARRWYRDHGRPVTIVIPSFRDAALVTRLVAKIRQHDRPPTASASSSPTTRAARSTSRRSRGSTASRSSPARPTAGSAVNANRGLRAADPEHDVVLLNSDVVPLRDWLACLQHAVSGDRPPGSPAPSCCTRTTGSSTAARSATPARPSGSTTAIAASRPTGDPPTSPARRSPPPARACTSGATSSTRSGCSTRRTAWATRTSTTACARGRRTTRSPTCRPRACTTTSPRPAAPSRASGSWRRSASSGSAGRRSSTTAGATDDGRLRVVYVTEGTIVGGGHRDVFEHLNGLADRGHDVALWTLEEAPDWFALRCPVRTFADYDELAPALAPLDAIKVATWWNTATAVWRASVVHGIPVYFVQDIETSYYPDAPERRYEVLDTYRPEFRFLTISGWNQERWQSWACTPSSSHRAWTSTRSARWPRRRAATTWCSRSAAPTRSRTSPSRSTRGAASPSRDPSCACSAPSPSWRPTRGSAMSTSPSDAEVNELLNQRHGVPADLHPRGLLPAGARGDGHRRRRGLHRRPRQPRLLRRRRQLPDARADAGRRGVRASAACSPIPTCAGASARRDGPPRLDMTGRERIDALERFMLELSPTRATGPRPRAGRSG